MTAIMQFKKLLEPGRIGKLELKNRIIMAPMGTNFATKDGFITDRVMDYYAERARGGCGLIICGVVAVDAPRGRNLECQIAISEDKFAPGLSELTDIVHRNGSQIAAQLVHAGKLAVADMTAGITPVSPSETAIGMKESLRDLTREEFNRMVMRFAEMPSSMKTRELTKEDIRELVDRFAVAAERAKNTGFDGVEIHAAHGYIISSFLSPAANKRQDEYGGDLSNRARFLLEVMAAVREKVGGEYPLWCRIDCREFGIKDGITAEDGKKLASMLEAAGANAVHVSGYGGIIGGFIDAPIVYQPGNLVYYVEEIKKSVRVPVIAVGRINPELAEKLLRENKADFIAMGRPILVDPQLPEKLACGERRDIRPCIYCYNCVSRHLEGEATKCTVNTAVGREKDFRIEPALQPKRVAVIGGGPAGMEAARLASLRGHTVTLFEKGRDLGGSLVFAAIVNSDMEDLLEWMVTQVRKLPIDIKLGSDVEPGLIERMNPDVIIVATGPGFTLPQIQGDDMPHVISGPELRGMLGGGNHTGKLPRSMKLLLAVSGPILRRLKPDRIRWLTKLWLPVGEHVAIIGGDLVAVELAALLSERGRRVTLLTEQPDIAAEMHIPARWRVLKNLRKGGVTMMSDIKIEAITGSGVIVNTYGEERQTVRADTVILAGEITDNTGLFQELKDRHPEVYQVGDCSGVRLLQGAMEDGAGVGLRI